MKPIYRYNHKRRVWEYLGLRPESQGVQYRWLDDLKMWVGRDDTGQPFPDLGKTESNRVRDFGHGLVSMNYAM